MSLEAALDEIRKTDFTKTVHRRSYPAISPTRSELSQAGKAILITGGGTGAGLAMAQSFVRASAATIIIVGRRADVLDAARSRLEQEAKELDTGAKIITMPCDLLKTNEVDALWKDLEAKGVFVDVYVANAAKFTEPNTLLELGTEEVWSQVETNVKSPLYFSEKFHAQKGTSEKQKVCITALLRPWGHWKRLTMVSTQFILNISTASIHAITHPVVVARPAYTLSKLSGTLLFQLLAQDIPREKTQIVSFHPGLLHNAYWQSVGAGPELFDGGKCIFFFSISSPQIGRVEKVEC
jgi:NAD(P)-dependent dehydrogenase (short-subunit alcohol dehydrogenase family)